MSALLAHSGPRTWNHSVKMMTAASAPPAAVIAGMAGADGLGKMVVEAISTINIAKGVEAGLGVVLIAVFLDRVTAALGTPAENHASLLGIMARRREAQRRAAASAPVPDAVLQPA